MPMAYVCERAVGPAKSCDFRSGRVILQQTLLPEQMRKLLAEGRTDLLRDFVSNRTRRKFAARLVRKPDGTTGFEFEPRPARAAKAAATAAPPVPAEEAPARSPDEGRSAKAGPPTRARKLAKAEKPASAKKAAKAEKPPNAKKAAKTEKPPNAEKISVPRKVMAPIKTAKTPVRRKTAVKPDKKADKKRALRRTA